MNPHLRLHDFTTSYQSDDSARDAREWVSAFNTSILTTRAAEASAKKGPDLSALMQTPEIKCLILAAQDLSNTLGISKEEATERMIIAFRNFDAAWTQLVIRRGLQSMLE